MRSTFDAAQVLDDETWAAITELRVDEPQAIRRHARQRGCRDRIAPDGRLVILAADHPARMVVDVRSGDGRIGKRRDYLARILRVLERGSVDGVMGTPDVIEELMAVSLLRTRERRPSLLDEKVLIGSMNRGGLAHTAFEMDDRFTAYTPEGLVQMNLDGGKMMLRLDPSDPASGATIEACAQAINHCLERDLEAFVETFMVERTERGYQTIREPRALMKAVSVASALGTSSLRTWLKLPYCDGYQQVAAATTCPILMLGGAARDDQGAVLAEFEAGMNAAPNVRGCLVGRNVLYPGEMDPAQMACAVCLIVHEDICAAEAIERAAGGEYDAQ